ALAPAATQASSDLEVPLPDLEVDESSSAHHFLEESAAPPARQPRTIAVPEPQPGPKDEAPERIVVDEALARPGRGGRSTMPSRLAEDDDDDEGPVTLASLLPDASEWPRRGEPRKRRREKPPA